MALTQVKSDGIATGAVTATQIAANAVTVDDISDGSISTAKLADDAVTADKLADTAVTAGSYGSASAIPAITVDAQGRITAASTNAIDSDRIFEGNTSAEAVDTGSDGHFKVVTEGTEALRVDENQHLLVGTNSASNNLRLDQKLAVVSTGSSNLGGAAFVSYVGTATDSASFIDLSRSRGTADGSVTSVANNDTLGWLIFRGTDGSDFINSSFIKGVVDDTPGTGVVPGRLEFYTASDGAPTERLRITNNGTLQLRNSPGIDFSQIQTNAGGMTSETLDSYEEGTWTPSFVHGTNGANMYVDNGLTIHHADYRKIGNLVYVSCYIENNTSFNYDTGRGGSDPLGIGGLPFTVSNTPAGSGYHPIYVGWFNNWTGWSVGYTPMGYFRTGASNIIFTYATANGTTEIQAQYMYSASSAILLSGWYRTN
jgi:hypothetical protein